VSNQCEAMMQGQIDGAVSENESLRREIARLRARVLVLEAAHEDASGAVLQERERCARACEDEARLWEADGKGPATEARLCAARIRALA
jgi:hypothetical protein